MRCLVPALLALPLVAAIPEDSSGGNPAPAVVRVLSGRATLVHGEEVEVLSRRSRSRRIEGAVYAECGPDAELDIAWRGLSSLRAEGTTAVEWEIAPATPDDPAVCLVRLATLDVEVRRGTMTIELPGAWVLAVERSAVQLRECGGRLEILHHGGQAVRVRSLVPRPGEEWPREVVSGERVYLPVALPKPEPDPPLSVPDPLAGD